MRICFVSRRIGDVRMRVGTYANNLIPEVVRAGEELYAELLAGRARAHA